jgi:hypothetical protein
MSQSHYKHQVEELVPTQKKKEKRNDLKPCQDNRTDTEATYKCDARLSSRMTMVPSSSSRKGKKLGKQRPNKKTLLAVQYCFGMEGSMYLEQYGKKM